LDSTGAVLNIGTSTATTINIGSALATIAIKGNMTFPNAYGLDSAGVLNIGTTTASSINIGKGGVGTAILGTLSVTQAASFSSTAQVVGAFNVNGMATTTVQGIIVPNATSTAPNVAYCSSANAGGLLWETASQRLCVCTGSTWVLATTTGACQ